MGQVLCGSARASLFALLGCAESAHADERLIVALEERRRFPRCRATG